MLKDLPNRGPYEGSAPISIESSLRRGICVIHVSGALDGNAHGQLEEALREAESGRARRILLDLDRVSSLDARTLHVILRASRRSAQNGHRLQVTRGRGHVADVFRMTALDRTVPFVGDPI